MDIRYCRERETFKWESKCGKGRVSHRQKRNLYAKPQFLNFSFTIRNPIVTLTLEQTATNSPSGNVTATTIANQFASSPPTVSSSPPYLLLHPIPLFPRLLHFSLTTCDIKTDHLCSYL